MALGMSTCCLVLVTHTGSLVAMLQVLMFPLYLLELFFVWGLVGTYFEQSVSISNFRI